MPDRQCDESSTWREPRGKWVFQTCRARSLRWASRRRGSRVFTFWTTTTPLDFHTAPAVRPATRRITMADSRHRRVWWTSVVRRSTETCPDTRITRITIMSIIIIIILILIILPRRRSTRSRITCRCMKIQERRGGTRSMQQTGRPWESFKPTTTTTDVSTTIRRDFCRTTAGITSRTCTWHRRLRCTPPGARSRGRRSKVTTTWSRSSTSQRWWSTSQRWWRNSRGTSSRWRWRRSRNRPPRRRATGSRSRGAAWRGRGSRAAWRPSPRRRATLPRRGARFGERAGRRSRRYKTRGWWLTWGRDRGLRVWTRRSPPSGRSYRRCPVTSWARFRRWSLPPGTSTFCSRCCTATRRTPTAPRTLVSVCSFAEISLILFFWPLFFLALWY